MSKAAPLSAIVKGKRFKCSVSNVARGRSPILTIIHSYSTVEEAGVLSSSDVTLSLVGRCHFQYLCAVTKSAATRQHVLVPVRYTCNLSFALSFALQAAFVPGHLLLADLQAY